MQHWLRRGVIACREFATREYRVYLLGGGAAQGGSATDSLPVYTPAELDKDQGGGIAVDALQLPRGYFAWQQGVTQGAGGPGASPICAPHCLPISTSCMIEAYQAYGNTHCTAVHMLNNVTI